MKVFRRVTLFPARTAARDVPPEIGQPALRQVAEDRAQERGFVGMDGAHAPMVSLSFFRQALRRFHTCFEEWPVRAAVSFKLAPST